jgi:hypothetical protein
MGPARDLCARAGYLVPSPSPVEGSTNGLLSRSGAASAEPPSADVWPELWMTVFVIIPWLVPSGYVPASGLPLVLAGGEAGLEHPGEPVQVEAPHPALHPEPGFPQRPPAQGNESAVGPFL